MTDTRPRQAPNKRPGVNGLLQIKPRLVKSATYWPLSECKYGLSMSFRDSYIFVKLIYENFRFVLP